MGRVSRYKKIKAVDPFSKSRGRVDEAAPGGRGKSKSRATHDLPPSMKDLDVLPSKMRETFKPRERLQPPKPPATSEVYAPRRSLSHIKALPGESMKSFARRVNAEATKRIQEVKAAAPIVKPVSDARRAYLDAKNAKKKAKAAAAHGADGEDMLPAGGSGAGVAAGAGGRLDGTHDAGADAGGGVTGIKRRRPDAEVVEEFPVDRVSFGDVVQAPPTLKAVPRLPKAQRQAQAVAALRRLMNKSEEEVTSGGGSASKRARSDDGSAGTAAAAAAAAKHSKDVAQAQMEQLRQQAMSAYANLKKRRAEDAKMASAGAAKSR